jgi:hypothetical protein
MLAGEYLGGCVMDIPVLVEPLGSQWFRATAFSLSAEGTTADEAVRRVRAELDSRLSAGARIEAIHVPAPATDAVPPPAAGILKDNPLYDDWREAMAEHRRQLDAQDRDW